MEFDINLESEHGEVLATVGDPQNASPTMTRVEVPDVVAHYARIYGATLMNNE